MPGFGLRFPIKTLEDAEFNIRRLYWLLTGRADSVNVLSAGSAITISGSVPVHNNTSHSETYATAANLAAHTTDVTNPHAVTAAQVVALRHDVGDTLPSASVSYRGQFYTLDRGAGLADILYVCTKDAGGGYTWKVVTVT
jgi:hypothetical protein